MKPRYLFLVEDKPKDELLILRALAKAGLQQEVRVARDGAEALERLAAAAAEPEPDLPLLVLLDIKLPKLDGLQVLGRLRADPRLCCLPVIMLSSSDDARDLRESCRLGANSYLRKPTGVERLNATMEALVRYWVDCHAHLDPGP